MRPLLVVPLVVLAFGGGFVVAHGSGEETAAPRDAGPMPTRLGDAQPDAGSMFRARFAAADAADGKEGLLLTPRSEEAECRDGCPLGVRVHGGERGRQESLSVLGSLKPQLRALLDASRERAPEFAASLSRFLAEYASASARRDEPGAPVPRMVFLAAPRPEFGPDHFGVAWAAYTHPDPHFDADFASHPASGMRLSVSRIDVRRGGDADRFALTAGDVCVTDVDGTSAPLPSDGPGAKILVVRGPLPGHFRGATGRAVGLFLDRDGTVEAYGRDLLPRRIDAGTALRRALTVLVERP